MLLLSMLGYQCIGRGFSAFRCACRHRQTRRLGVHGRDIFHPHPIDPPRRGSAHPAALAVRHGPPGAIPHELLRRLGLSLQLPVDMPEIRLEQLAIVILECDVLPHNENDPAIGLSKFDFGEQSCPQSVGHRRKSELKQLLRKCVAVVSFAANPLPAEQSKLAGERMKGWFVTSTTNRIQHVDLAQQNLIHGVL